MKVPSSISATINFRIKKTNVAISHLAVGQINAMIRAAGSQQISGILFGFFLDSLWILFGFFLDSFWISYHLIGLLSYALGIAREGHRNQFMICSHQNTV